MDYNFIILYIIAAIIIVWLICITVLGSNVVHEDKNDINETYDSMYHLSTETLNGVEFSKNLVTQGYDFINLNQVYDSTNISKTILDGTTKSFKTGEWVSTGVGTNYNVSPINGYGGLYDKDNVYAFNLLKFVGTETVECLKGTNGNWAYAKKLLRISDNKEFLFVSLSQNFGGYRKSNSYKALYELFLYIKTNYDLPVFIIGDFNVHGHNEIAKMIFGETDYHIFDGPNHVTCNDNEGLASPDGFIISKSLYPRVSYHIDTVKTTSWQHYALKLKLYRIGIEELKNETSKEFSNMIDNYVLPKRIADNADIFYKKEVTIPDKSVIDGWSINNITKTTIESSTTINP